MNTTLRALFTVAGLIAFVAVLVASVPNAEKKDAQSKFIKTFQDNMEQRARGAERNDLIVANNGLIYVVRYNTDGNYIGLKANSYPETVGQPSGMKGWMVNIIKEKDTPQAYAITAAQYVKQ